MERESFFKKVNDVVFLLLGDKLNPGQNGGYHNGAIKLATPSDTYSYFGSGIVLGSDCKDVTDQELIKLWPHRTNRWINGERGTKESLEKELALRGYEKIHPVKNKWRKVS